MDMNNIRITDKGVFIDGQEVKKVIKLNVHADPNEYGAGNVEVDIKFRAKIADEEHKTVTYVNNFGNTKPLNFKDLS